MTRPPLTDHMLDRADASFQDRPGGLAQQLEDWAADPHPDDVEDAGTLFVQASEHWIGAGTPGRAVDAARRAVDTGDEVPPDTRCYLVDALLAAGRLDEADAVAGELRRAHGDDPLVLVFLGESYEEAGQLDQAHRWYTMGLTAAERHGDPSGVVPTLLAGRFRVRRELELPVDEYDLEADGGAEAAEAVALVEEDGSNPDAFFRS